MNVQFSSAKAEKLPLATPTILCTSMYIVSMYGYIVINITSMDSIDYAL